jgi:hypothetical protein
MSDSLETIDQDVSTSLTAADIHDAVSIIEEKSSPVSRVEENLADFLSDAFAIAKADNDFLHEIQDEIRNRLSKLDDSKLLALHVNHMTNRNDIYSKLVAPTMQLATAQQQAELAATKERQAAQSSSFSQTNIKEINNQVPQNVLAGMKTLNDLLSMLSKQPTDSSDTSA